MTQMSASARADAPPFVRRCVLVTGPSGAGRSTALNVLEDAGFETIDNLPLSMLRGMLEDTAQTRPLALGVDARSRGFSTDALLDLLGQMAGRADLSIDVLYLDCAPNVLLRRFSETRRRHPLADGGPPVMGIDREQALLQPLRSRADVLIDTTELNIHELRTEVEQWFAPEGQHLLSVSVQSFSYKRGLPRSVDMVFDCRFLRNPHWDPTLRNSDGRDASVAAYVAKDPRFAEFADQVYGLSMLLLPAFREEGKSNISIAFGCTGGQHRSVAMAEQHALRLAQQGWQVSTRHRELDRQLEGHGNL